MTPTLKMIVLIFIILSSCIKSSESYNFSELIFIDHQNLRYVEDEATIRFQVESVKKNMDRASEYGIDTYLFFAKETFEAMLNYDFEATGLGNIGEKAFPPDSEHRRTAEYLRAALKNVLAYAAEKNIQVFFHSNQFIFPQQVLNVIKPKVWGTAVCPGRDITWEIYRKKLNDFLTLFPGISGFQVTGDETQVSVLECRCDSCQHLSFVDRVNLLTKETASVCKTYDKEVQMRTWQRMGELEHEMHPSDMGNDVPANVFFSIKNTNGDFHLPYSADVKFLNAVDPNRVVVEFDAWREYDGNNYFPCYMGDTWASRFKLLDQLNIKRIAVRLNWNSNKNAIFERPWGNWVNIYLFLKLAEHPDRSPDDILYEYIDKVYPKSARRAAFDLYKFSPGFQTSIYYVNGEYWANHSRVQDDDAVGNLKDAQSKGYLIQPEHFAERQQEIENLCAHALNLIDNLGPEIPETWRDELITGVNVEKYVALSTIFKMEAIYWKKENNQRKLNSVKHRILKLQHEWDTMHPESYKSMKGDDAINHIN